MVNAFSGEGGGIAPGELVVLFGSGLGQPVTVGGAAADVSFASSTQIHTRIPETLTIGSTVTIAAGDLSTTANVVISRPGLFASAFNADGLVNSSSDPIKPEGIVVLYATGTDPAQATISVAGVQAELLYSGTLAGALGVVQINVRIPADARGTLPLAIAGGNAITVFVQ